MWYNVVIKDRMSAGCGVMWLLGVCVSAKSSKIRV